MKAQAWLRANKHRLGALTGTDAKALDAIDLALELYSYTHSESSLRAVALLASEMQPKTRYLARELIAKAMDWPDRDRLWPRIESLIEEPARMHMRIAELEVQISGDADPKGGAR